MSLLETQDIIIIKKIDGGFVDGYHVGEYNSYSRNIANIQPVNDRELQMLKEGDRVKGTIKIYCEDELIDNDFLRISSENTKKVVTCTVNNVIDSIDYICIINSSKFIYNSGIGATELSIVNGIVTEISNGNELVDVVDNLDGTYTITSKIEGTNFNISVGYNQSFNIDTENIQKEYKIMQSKDYTPHDIKHYKAYGFLVERKNGL